MLYLELSNYEYAIGDYGRSTTFKVYQEDRSTAQTLASYTAGKIRVLDSTGAQLLQDITATIDAGTSGTGSFTTTSSNTWNTEGYAFVELELSKSGEVTSTVAARVYVRNSPYP